jgi:hypothetical protein
MDPTASVAALAGQVAEAVAAVFNLALRDDRE